VVFSWYNKTNNDWTLGWQGHEGYYLSLGIQEDMETVTWNLGQEFTFLAILNPSSQIVSPVPMVYSHYLYNIALFYIVTFAVELFTVHAIC
jgi:hypothetical protein